MIVSEEIFLKNLETVLGFNYDDFKFNAYVETYSRAGNPVISMKVFNLVYYSECYGLLRFKVQSIDKQYYNCYYDPKTGYECDCESEYITCYKIIGDYPCKEDIIPCVPDSDPF